MPHRHNLQNKPHASDACPQDHANDCGPDTGIKADSQLPAGATKDGVTHSDTAFPPVETLVPHARPMLLIDRIIAADDLSMQADVTIHAQSLFCSDEYGVPAYVGIEYIAQTVSAYSGWRALQASKTGNSQPRIGYLLGTRKMTMAKSGFKPGDHLIISVENIFEDGEMGVFEGTVRRNQEVIVSARVNVYQPEIQNTPKS
ncbi:ApeP family dehydratase [Thalassospira marina]|uniref:3-hydroxydecanoyl-ACP dehydratase n=1 Tax=Thalassospira marina TaxID=2048283 RepID=A0A2N3KRH3_9PROT|nr:3-hydroxydecanoyl-ACP dehydratase [Thalassospira marina]PKR53135.1 3-hydroxydecanoyl-ACP dehydratase [Thalassospira marina]